jgi:hypothetical protein
MGNNEAALGGGALNRVKHRSTERINKIRDLCVQRLSSDAREVVQKMIRSELGEMSYRGLTIDPCTSPSEAGIG